MENIKFGTDGWRAVVGKDFNKENVHTVTKAIGKYVFDNFGTHKKIIVGFDPRNMAEEFALQTANQLAGYGFNVLLSDKVIPTPVLAYSAKYLNACAVMFTASHNPPEYLGIKFIPDYAGPATSEITDELMINLHIPFRETGRGSVERYNFRPDYFNHIEKLIDFERIKTLDKNIIFDGLYAASIGYFDKILDTYGIKYDSLHMFHDINFGGGVPEPKPKYLKELIEKVKTTPNSVGLANDGDSDRFGVINEHGEYVSPNEIIAILLIHLTKNKGRYSFIPAPRLFEIGIGTFHPAALSDRKPYARESAERIGLRSGSNTRRHCTKSCRAGDGRDNRLRGCTFGTNAESFATLLIV